MVISNFNGNRRAEFFVVEYCQRVNIYYSSITTIQTQDITGHHRQNLDSDTLVTLVTLIVLNSEKSSYHHNVYRPCPYMLFIFTISTDNG